MKLAKPKLKIGKEGSKAEKPAKNARAPRKTGASKGNKFVLLLGDEGAILTFIQGGKVTRRLFAPSPQEEHVHTLVELMQSFPKAPVYLLVDMIDQSYVRHNLPPVSPLSINKLVQRRLDRDFAAEDITGSLNLGREKTGRKEWNFLLISLANNTLLQQWLEVILNLPNHFKGIYLVPVEGQEYIGNLNKALNDKDDRNTQWQILVSHDKVGGFRQIVLKDGKLIFTRLTQSMGDVMPEVMAGSVEQELQNTIEYLRRLSYDERSGLEIYIVVAQEIKDAIDENKLKAQRAYLLTPYEVSQALGQEQSALAGDRYGDVVMATAFGQSKKRCLKLMSKQAASIEKLYTAKTAIRVVVALACLALVYLSVTTAMNVFSAKSEISKFNAQRGGKQQELQEAQQNLERLGNDVNMLMSVATLYQETKPDEPNILIFVREIGRLMDEKALVKSLTWKRGLKSGEGAAVTSATTPAEGTLYTSDKITADIAMEFIKHEGDQQKLLADADSFLDRLGAVFEGYEITHEKLPGVISEDEKLEVNFDDQSAGDTTLKEGENIVKLTISGPVEGGTTPAADMDGGLP